jgi:predicted CoA-substrate-specific enzyme activase
VKSGGIDIGSRYIKYVVLEEGRVTAWYKQDTGHDPFKVCRGLIQADSPHCLVATGYGRHLFEIHDNVPTITEIKAVARGARAFLPSCRTIIDIGGQDTKVVSLHEEGAVSQFEMNDRCAAGTGRFLEIMARVLGYDIEHFGSQCLCEKSDIKINSMCTVFAESEVISLIAKGTKREHIGASLHESVVSKVLSLAKRAEAKDDVVFAGGCARNPYLRKILEERLDRTLHIHEEPDILAALGAALYGADKTKSNSC